MKSELLQICIPLFVVSMVLLSIMYARVKPMKATKRLTLLYIVVAALAFGLLAFIGLLELRLNLYYSFAISGIFLLTVGLFNTYLAKRLLPWYEDVNFLFGFIFNFIIAAIGTIFYLYGYFYLTGMGLNTLHLFNITFFFIPFFVNNGLKFYFEIPTVDYKKWHYPIGKEIIDPSEVEMESPLVIAFEFQKRFDREDITTFRAKAPMHMKFGKLFYYFILDYNTKHSDSKVEYIYERSKPYGWIFYIKPTWIGRRIYIDPDLTISDNLIEEDSVIIAQRVLE